MKLVSRFVGRLEVSWFDFMELSLNFLSKKVCGGRKCLVNVCATL